ncbi:MAG: glycosyltransferase [Halanaerobiales bacterium]|nr:glycosyltransferase [Halanaerobiales bacterium]
MQKDISCNIKAFLRPEKFEQCLLSVLNAGVKDIIVGYDGSPALRDLHAGIVDKYSKNANITFLVFPFNKGLSAVRNAMIRMSDSTYILQLDDDNYISPNTLSMLPYLENRSNLGGIGISWLHGKTYLPEVEAWDVKINDGYLERVLRLPKNVDVSDGLVYWRPFDIIPNNGIFRKELFQEVQWDERIKIGREHEDFFLTCKRRTNWEFAITPSINAIHDCGGNEEFISYREGIENERGGLYFNKKWNINGIRGDSYFINGTRYQQIMQEKGLNIINKEIENVRNNAVYNIRHFKDIHKDKRCFILGCGPSLSGIDTSKLENEITFGCNRIFEHLGLKVKYYGVESRNCVIEREEDIKNFDCKFKFIPAGYSQLMELPNIVPLDFRNPITYPQFSFDCDKTVYWGSNVVFMILQIVAYMGCNPIYLLGQDWFETGAETRMHFYEEAPNARYDNPAIERQNAAMNHAAKVLEEHGYKVWNLTPNTKLKAFKKKDIEKVLV